MSNLRGERAVVALFPNKLHLWSCFAISKPLHKHLHFKNYNLIFLWHFPWIYHSMRDFYMAPYCLGWVTLNARGTGIELTFLTRAITWRKVQTSDNCSIKYKHWPQTKWTFHYFEVGCSKNLPYLKVVCCLCGPCYLNLCQEKLTLLARFFLP